jgi:hypothetical protein
MILRIKISMNIDRENMRSIALRIHEISQLYAKFMNKRLCELDVFNAYVRCIFK